MKCRVSALVLLALVLSLSLVRPAHAAKLLAITFDDGPSPVYTPQVLDELDKRNVKATFFMVGKWLPGKQALLDRMVSEGHEIASHTYDHMNLTDATPSQVREQIKKNREALSSYTGLSDFLVRTPFGVRQDTVLKNLGAPLILWSIDPAAGKQVPGNKMAQKVISSAKDGDIILLHDTTQYNLDAVGPILDTLRAKGFDFVTVSELFRLRGVDLKDGVIYKRAPAAASAKQNTSWAQKDIQYVQAKGIMTGDRTGWHPEKTMTRAMAVTTLWRACGTPQAKTKAGFLDVSPYSWYTQAVDWGRETGLIQGKTEKRFAPNDSITRQELYVLLARLLQSQGVQAPQSGEVPVYEDSFRVSAWARPEVQYLQRLGFVSANDKELLRPGDKATRAEAAELLHWYLERQ